jgi:hypothetical protein
MTRAPVNAVVAGCCAGMVTDNRTRAAQAIGNVCDFMTTL